MAEPTLLQRARVNLDESRAQGSRHHAATDCILQHLEQQQAAMRGPAQVPGEPRCKVCGDGFTATHGQECDARPPAITHEEARTITRNLGIDTTAWAAEIRERVAAADMAGGIEPEFADSTALDLIALLEAGADVDPVTRAMLVLSLKRLVRLMAQSGDGGDHAR